MLLRLLIVAAMLVLPRSGRAEDPAFALEQKLIDVIEQAEPAVVSIARIRPQPMEGRLLAVGPLERPMFPHDAPTLDPENPDFQPNSYGAGVLLAGARPGERIVLTNYHVVQGGPVSPLRSAADGTTLFVRFSDRRACAATILAADPRSDLATLHLDLERNQIDPAELKVLEWSSGGPVRKGQFVLLLGNPYALAHDGSASASWGMVSNVARRPLPWTDDMNSRSLMYRLGNLIQIDARINLGTSGGPVLNLKGELVGLTTSLAAIDGYEKSAGFAIPLDGLMRRIVDSLAAGHEVEYGMLGVAPRTETPSEFRLRNTGLKQRMAVRVQHVALDSPAHRAGLVPDDVIVSVQGIPVQSDFDLMRIVGLHAPESEVEIAAWRRERGLFTTRAKLVKWPVSDLIEEGIIETIPRVAPWRGISVDYSTGRRRFQRDDDRHRRAVVVTRVAPDSPARTASLEPGQFITEVNRISVQTPSEFAEATRTLRGPVELRLYDGGRIVIPE